MCNDDMHLGEPLDCNHSFCRTCLAHDKKETCFTCGAESDHVNRGITRRRHYAKTSRYMIEEPIYVNSKKNRIKHIHDCFANLLKIHSHFERNAFITLMETTLIRLESEGMTNISKYWRRISSLRQQLQYEHKRASAVVIQRHMKGVLTRLHYGMHNPHCENGQHFIRSMFARMY